MKNAYYKENTVIYCDDYHMYGFITDKISTLPKYNSIQILNSERYIVSDNKGYKIVSNEDIDITTYYEYMMEHGDGVIVRKEVKHGLIDPDGNILLPIKYDFIYGNGIGKKGIKLDFNRGYATYDYYYDGKVNNSYYGIPERIDYGIVKVKLKNEEINLLKSDFFGNVFYREKDVQDKYAYVDAKGTGRLLQCGVNVLYNYEKNISYDGVEYINAILYNILKEDNKIVFKIIDYEGNEIYSIKNGVIQRSKNATFLVTNFDTDKCMIIDSKGRVLYSDIKQGKDIKFCDDFIIVREPIGTSIVIDYDGNSDIFNQYVVNIAGNKDNGLYACEYLENDVYKYFYFKWKDGIIEKYTDKIYDYACVYDNITISMKKESDYTHNNICEKWKYYINDLYGNMLYKIDNPFKIGYIQELNSIYYVKDGIATLINIKTGYKNTIKCDDIEYGQGYFVIKINNMYGLMDNSFKEIIPCVYDSMEILGHYVKVSTSFDNWTLSNYHKINNMPDINTEYYLIDINDPYKIISHGSDLVEEKEDKVLRKRL